MKPIVRWTVGEVSQLGIECLNLSIEKFINLYGNLFDYYVCYNNIELSQIHFLKKYKVNFLNQKKYRNSLLINPIDNNPCWKLYPPRINKEVHEIFIDNDLIIFKKIPLIDEFLNSKNLFLITQAYNRSYASSLRNLIRNNLNSGLIAIPPGFNFKERINQIIKEHNISWISSHFQEQAVVSKIIEENNFKIIKLSEIYVCYEKLIKANYGYHFVGINSNFITKFFKAFKLIY